MILRLYNTLSRTLEDFTPLHPPTVGLYACGPTVYDDPHIGHARSAYIFEVIRRYLAYRGFEVRFVRNVTDVDDKIIAKAQEELGAGGGGRGARDLKATCQEVAERYLKSYHGTMDRLGIARPDVEPRATESIDEMTDLISKLVVDGIAYEAGGDVYFAVRKFPGYGKLSNRTLDELQAGARVEPDEQKQDPLDFALWKAAKPGEPFWSSPWGKGRPGWHIECTAMSTKYLGDEFDIHGGGVDLVFPHHENEIAQAKAAGKPFARYWVHNGLLTVNGEKMSKSLGNFITVEQALEQCHGDANVLKTFFLGTHYQSPLDYTLDNLKAAAGRSNSFYDFLFMADSQRSSADFSKSPVAEISELQSAFTEAMDNDLKTPEALTALDKLTNRGYQWWKELESSISRDAQETRKLKGKIVMAADAIFELSKVLGLNYEIFKQEALPPEEKHLLEQREAARKRKDFKTADKIREALLKKGFMIRDTFGGPVAIPLRKGI